MNSHRLASVIAGIAALGYAVTAVIHGTGLSSISRLAAETSEGLGAIVPALWLAFSFNLLITGVMVAIIAFRPMPPGRPLLIVAALCPLSAAGLQLWYLGFIPPTALLLGVGAITIIAAMLFPNAGVVKAVEK